MIINIPDSASPEDRRNVLDVYPIVYALKVCKGSFERAAEFLGVTRRSLTGKIASIPELHGFHKKRTFDDLLEKYSNDEFDPAEKTCALHKAYQYHLRKSMHSFWYVNASDEEKHNFIERLKKLYSIMK